MFKISSLNMPILDHKMILGIRRVRHGHTGPGPERADALQAAGCAARTTIDAFV